MFIQVRVVYSCDIIIIIRNVSYVNKSSCKFNDKPKEGRPTTNNLDMVMVDVSVCMCVFQESTCCRVAHCTLEAKPRGERAAIFDRKTTASNA